MAQRKIVHIDETKCNGCGECVPSCAEGAIAIVNGKAKLVSDVYCDGLGACLGRCPKDAITIVDRDAEEFDEHAAHQHVAQLKSQRGRAHASSGCPGAAVHSLGLPLMVAPAMAARMPQLAAASGNGNGASDAGLANWPIQLHLVPPAAPFLRQADVVLVADCVPFAYADFHREIVRGRPILIGCPKLDDAAFYIEKLADILTVAEVRSLTVVHMEVPCCMGLMRIAEGARRLAGRDVPVEEVTISIRGQKK